MLIYIDPMDAHDKYNPCDDFLLDSQPTERPQLRALPESETCDVGQIQNHVEDARWVYSLAVDQDRLNGGSKNSNSDSGRQWVAWW